MSGNPLQGVVRYVPPPLRGCGMGVHLLGMTPPPLTSPLSKIQQAGEGEEEFWLRQDEVFN